MPEEDFQSVRTDHTLIRFEYRTEIGLTDRGIDTDRYCTRTGHHLILSDVTL